MVFEELNQTAVNNKIGLGFAAALRTILRQDPDIIMLGEIRDFETAENAIQAALTGHLVLSTLHTKDTASAVTRLIDLGVEPFLISSTLIGVLAQRLVRKNCRHCSEELPLSEDQAKALGLGEVDGAEPITVRSGMGCNHCRQTGYRGRDGVYEILPITDRIRKLIGHKADSVAILEQARREGLTTLREAAIRKLAEGVTSFEEVIRVTSDR
jgi:general secretion pathway protein E